jgi:hypothetical protein
MLDAVAQYRPSIEDHKCLQVHLSKSLSKFRDMTSKSILGTPLMTLAATSQVPTSR